MDQRDKDGVLMINVSEGNNHLNVIELRETETNHAHEERETNHAHEVTESQDIISLESNSREDENIEIVSENKSINNIENLGKDNEICEHESDCATVTSPPPVSRPTECQCNCHCQSAYINSAFQYEESSTSGKIITSTFNNDGNGEKKRSSTPTEHSFHAISIDNEENSEGISNKVVLEYNEQSNSVILANSSNSSKNKKTNIAGKKPPSYNKLGGLILDDEPPKYEKVTGIKLHDELVSYI